MKYLQETCRLCQSAKKLLPVIGPDKRSYCFCKNCYMVNVKRKYLPDKQAEKARYLTHQNGIQFEGYVRFLYQAIEPVLGFIKKDMVGLDYGCGPAPTLSKLMSREGYECEDYDPFFVQNDLDRQFGFIFVAINDILFFLIYIRFFNDIKHHIYGYSHFFCFIPD